MVKPLAWMRAVRDHRPKAAPRSSRYAVLWALGLRMDADGAGFASQAQLAEDTTVTERTVRGHLAWARGVGFLELTHRGHRRGDGTVAASEFHLALPATSGRLTSTGNRQPVEVGLNRKDGRSQPEARFRPGALTPEDAVQGHLGTARAAAVLAVLPDRLAGGITRSTLEQACAELPDGWTPEALGLAAAAASWPDDARKGGMVIGWVRSLRDQRPPKRPLRSKPVAKHRCPNGRPYAADGTCCGSEHAEGAA